MTIPADDRAELDARREAVERLQWATPVSPDAEARRLERLACARRLLAEVEAKIGRPA